ncbi:MAG TPA: TerC family protein, partial [Cellvibrionaceae bacterium]|nr:TerC family protein [Cellvibrionaceae bacterium]
KGRVKEAAGWSIGWFAMAIAFNAGLWWHLTGTLGSEIADQKALEFFTGYLIEKSLSVDNVFIFLLIFSAFAVPPEYQRRVLIYGVLGAIVMRIIMILLGSWVVQEFKWILYIFGAFLLFTGIKMLWASDSAQDMNENWLVKWARKHIRITPQLHGEKFTVRQEGVLYFTPLFLVLILVEVSDLVFAVDSIPAIFAITTDPFIVATSNIFAILGLRALYFLLADMAERFHLLKYGLAVVLAFIGTKLLITPWFHMPIALSLGFVVVVISLSIVASLWVTRKQANAKTAPSHQA